MSSSSLWKDCFCRLNCCLMDSFSAWNCALNCASCWSALTLAMRSLWSSSRVCEAGFLRSCVPAAFCESFSFRRSSLSASLRLASSPLARFSAATSRCCNAWSSYCDNLLLLGLRADSLPLASGNLKLLGEEGWSSRGVDCASPTRSLDLGVPAFPSRFPWLSSSRRPAVSFSNSSLRRLRSTFFSSSNSSLREFRNTFFSSSTFCVRRASRTSRLVTFASASTARC
mmetsp:Transcript_2453/g.7332  ORF Transcript_2453/g.7332 Transcript_2453/m.7332 type:complete len:227 (+) Transcript_2453:1072-1752(+)